MKKKYLMFSLHDKPTLTSNIFNAGFSALHIYQNMLHEKKYLMFSLHDKPTLTSNIFNAGFSALHIYQNMLHEKVSNVEFARQTNTDTKYLQCSLQCSTYIAKHACYMKKKCPMLSLYDNPTLTHKV